MTEPEAGEVPGAGEVADVGTRFGYDRIVAAIVLVVAAVIRLPTLNQPLVEAHPFRQTQTALTALLYHRNGIDLFHTPLPVVGPPWEVPFEFPLFQAGAAMLMNLGIPMEPALRGLSLICFLATGAVLWKLVDRERGAVAALAALAFFLFSPFSLLWSRASTIEYLATLLGVSFVALALAWQRPGRWSTYAGGLVVGSLAMAVKITTGVIWLGPALLVLRGRIGWRLALVAIPLAIGWGWTQYADSIKATGVITSHLTSTAVADFTIGPIAQRFNGDLLHAFDRWAWPMGIAGLVGLMLIRPRLEWPGLRTWFAMALVAGPVLFTNLYLVHSYYWIAVSPAIAGLLGAALAAPIERWPRPWVAALTVAVATFFAVATFLGTTSSWSMAYKPVWDPENVLGLAQQIRDETEPGDLVYIEGRDWTPGIFLYADRRGIMLPAFIDPAALDLTGYRKFNCPGWYQPGLCTQIR